MDKFKKKLKELLPYIIIILVVIIIKFFIVTPIRVNGPSMENTLHDKDIMLLNEISYKFHKIERFDIVVIKYKNEYLIKRVIGLPGEKVKYKNNKLYINNKYIKEKFSHKKTKDFKTKKIPKDNYIVLGDNRTDSVDSRMIGFIKKKDIKGKTSFTILPFNRFGHKE
ncbi:MAG: signal peptidase I [Bacilli bacterium]|nr:signal peptidase I [Bacilli bacterium]